MKRTLLLCFVHGFKGNTATFYDFPEHLKDLVSAKLPEEVRVELAVYPKYETAGSLADCTAKFREWLVERVMELRKETSETPWPPTDRSVGVVLVAHSMGGFVAADALISVLNDQPATEELVGQESRPIFPLIRGVLTFDTPYNGLARAMFVYGAFSQYQKVGDIWNIMSVVTTGIAGGTAALSASSRASKMSATPTSKPAWKLWQTIAIRSGAAGTIAAGGVAAYTNREKIRKSIASFDKGSLGRGYSSLGQGLAYVNQESIGQGFAWISNHTQFVGALTKQEEMKQRLVRLSAIEGIGIANMYASLGENGTWTGGYFVPERTFCAIPSADEKAHGIFLRQVNTVADDEIDAHMTMFRPEKNKGYTKLSEDARDKVISWFEDDSRVVDPLRPTAQQQEQEKEKPQTESCDVDNLSEVEDQVLTNSDLSPSDLVDIASAVPLPEDDVPSRWYEGYLSSIGAKLSLPRPFNRSQPANENLMAPSTMPPDPENKKETADVIEPKNGAAVTVGGSPKASVSKETADAIEPKNGAVVGGSPIASVQKETADAIEPKSGAAVAVGESPKANVQEPNGKV